MSKKTKIKSADGAAVLVLAALVIGVFFDALASGGRFVASSPRHDLAALFAPWLAFGFGEIKSGRFPLWNPYSFSGTPFFATFQTALLYPVNWAHLLLPLGKALNAVLLFHVMGAGVAMYSWRQARGASPEGALLAAIAFMFCGPFFLRVYAGHLPLLCAMAWAPALVWSLEAAGAGSPAGYWLGAFCAAMQILAGSPQIFYYGAFTSAAYLSVLAFRGERRYGVVVLALAGVYLGGAVLAAAQVLPGLDAAAQSYRAGGMAYSFASSFSLPPKAFLSLILPPRAEADSYFWETTLFFGVIPLLAALMGAWRERGASLATSLVCLLLALGAHTPLFGFLYRFAPGFDLFRGVSKFSFFAVLFLCALAARGLDEVRAVGGVWAARLLVVLAGGEMIVFAFSHRALMPLSLTYPEDWSRPAVSAAHQDERVLHDYRVFPNLGVILGLRDIWGDDSFVLKRYARFIAATQGRDPSSASNYELIERLPPILSMLRLRHAFFPGDQTVIRSLDRPLGRLLLLSKWEELPQDAALKRLMEPSFDPRAEVLLESPPDPRPGVTLEGAKVHLLSERNDELEVEAELSAPAILLVTDSYARGWKARALEKNPLQPRYDVLPADYTLKAIALSAGRHHFRLEYQPGSFLIGKWISISAWLLFFIFGWRWFRTEK